MPLSNKELAKRADIAISDLDTNGGLLNPEQSNAFIDMVADQPTILKEARVVRMSAPQRKINRLGFGQRILKAAPQGTSPYAADDGTNDRYLAAADRSSVTSAQITLTTKEIMAEVHLPYEVLEDNIEGESFEAHVMRLIAERAALDLEDWALTADTGSGDAYLALTDGLLKQSTSNVLDHASAGINPDLFTNAMLTMPQQYLPSLDRMRHYITVQDEIRYRSNVAKRTTGYGDSVLTTDGRVNAFGVPVRPTPRMVSATGLFTFPDNILFGIQRQISVETDKDIRARSIIIVLTIRCDILFDDELAVVKMINVA